MATYLILAAVVLICAYAVYSYIRKLRVGGGCCGEREAAPKRVKVRDRDKRHYPYVLEVTVDGMVCANCARRVENALNSLDGVWARVEDVGSARRPLPSLIAPRPRPRPAGSGRSRAPRGRSTRGSARPPCTGRPVPCACAGRRHCRRR